MGLMSFDEMKKRYHDGDDSLELTMEKWERIADYSKRVFDIYDFQELFKAAVVPVFLCTEYSNQCHICPIYNVCMQGRSDDWTTLMRVVQAYAIAGDLLPKEPLLGHIDVFLSKLKLCRDDLMGSLH